MRFALGFAALAVAWSTLAVGADDCIVPFLKPGIDVDNVPHQVFDEGAFLLGGRRDVWQGSPKVWGGRCASDAYDYGFFAGCGNNGRNASISARTVGEQTGRSRAGSLQFATTTRDNPGSPIVRVEITADGDVLINPDQDPVTLRIGRPHQDGETALVTSFKANGRAQIDRVVIGEPDSCGKGYRCLRISN
jgi:hypothetical protein